MPLIDAAHGRVSTTAWGDDDAPLVVCVPGLSQDERSFAALGPRLAGTGHHVVAVSPRGRGGSDVTAPGTYGWPHHAADVAALATVLGADAFDVVGWSFGAFVGMTLANEHPDRVRRLVLLDAVGRPDPSALGPIVAGLERLGAVYDSPEEYRAIATSSGGMSGCAEAWDGYLAGDLVAVGSGYSTRTDKDAVLEDSTYGATHDPYELWPALTMPTLLVRAAQPVLPGLGWIVTEQDRDRFPTVAPGGRVAEVDANHYCVGMVTETADLLEEHFHA